MSDIPDAGSPTIGQNGYVEPPLGENPPKEGNTTDGSNDAGGMGTLEDMKKKYPEFYEEYMRQFGEKMMKEMKKHQDKINKEIKNGS